MLVNPELPLLATLPMSDVVYTIHVMEEFTYCTSLTAFEIEKKKRTVSACAKLLVWLYP